MKAILYQHIVQMKSKTLDRILYLFRVLNRDKVDLDGRYKPPLEPADMDVKSYHADYNDRTAYRIEHGLLYKSCIVLFHNQICRITVILMAPKSRHLDTSMAPNIAL
jgi:hypothetical protein